MAAKKKSFTANTKAPKKSYAVTEKQDGKTVKKYPVDSLPRARNALSRVGQSGTAEEKRKVYAKVRATYPALAKRSSVVPTKSTKRGKK